MLLPRKTIRRILKEEFGVNRISKDALELLSSHLEKLAINIIKDSIKYSKFFNRNTLIKKDIELWEKKKSLKKY